MLLHALHRRLLAGIVLFALMLQMVLPAIAGAASGPGSRWIEVCAASGAKWIKIDDGHGSEHASADHCVLCAATGPVPEFDVRSYLPPALVDVHATQPSDHYIRVFRGYATLSRAPPAQS